jgi:hypothetical protein
LRPQLLPTAATTTTTLALLSATPIPVVGTNDDVRNLAIGAAICLWFAFTIARATGQVQQHLGDVRAEVDEIRRHTHIERLLQDAGAGSALTLPTPHGDIHPVPVEVDGATVLAGVDEHATLGTVLEFRRAMADDDRAAQ